ncbi:MAG: sigma factor-like helix-turn-helix DNA-binding protein, partial [Acidimicrobiales bacterium]
GFDAWLHRVLVRCVYREADRERSRAARTVQVRDIPGPSDPARGLEDRDALDRGFRRLRPEHRAVLVLRHYMGFSDDEAAAALAVPTGTIKSRLNRATSALRAELEADARRADRLAVESVR